MNRKTIYIILILLFGGLLFLLGIYVGKKTLPQKVVTKIEYVKGETVHDSIDRPVPVYVKTPVDTANLIAQCVKDGIFYELFPEKIKWDTLYVDKTDSAKILSDWASLRKYEETLFDSDTLGTMKINTTVQYNRLGTIYYDYTPVVKEVTNTVYLKRKFIPFAGAGISTFPSYNVEFGGIINQSWGVSLQGNFYPNIKKEENIPVYDFGFKFIKTF